MHWNNIPGEECLRLWKNLRINIEDKPLEFQLQRVVEFCAHMPIGSRTIDYYSSENWPTPWEILFHSSYCTSSISLLMFYTLSLLSSNLTIELVLVEDDGGIYLLPIIDNQYILNYELGQVSKYPDTNNSFKILKRYTRGDVKIT